MAVIRFTARVGTRPGRVIVQIVGHDEIKPAIAVVIEEARRCAPVQALQPGLLGDLPEATVALIEEKPRTAELRDQHVGPAVVVDVANGDAHAVTGNIHPGARADIGEPAVRFLPNETVGGL